MTTQPAEQYGEPNDPTNDQQPDNSVIRGLREKEKGYDAAKADADAARARALAAEQKIALLELGIKPDSAQGKKLLRLHDGDWTPDALRATATEYGENLPGVVPSEQEEAAARMASVAEGAEHTTGTSDVQGELNKLPKFGDPNFYAGKQQLLNLVAESGGQIVRDRPQSTTWVNPFTGQRMAAYDERSAAPRA